MDWINIGTPKNHLYNGMYKPERFHGLWLKTLCGQAYHINVHQDAQPKMPACKLCLRLDKR